MPVLTPYSREEFWDCADLEVSDPVERARRFMFGVGNRSRAVVVNLGALRQSGAVGGWPMWLVTGGPVSTRIYLL